MKLSILVETKAPEPRDEYKKPNLIEKAKEYIRRVDAPEIESKQEWNYLKRLYERLIKNSSPQGYSEKQIEDILCRLEDLFEKYSNKDHEGAVEMDAQSMNRGTDNG